MQKPAVRFAESTHIFRRATTLPYYGVVKRLARFFIPRDYGFALIRYAYAGNLMYIVRAFQHLNQRRKRFGVNLVCIFFDERRLGVELLYRRRLLHYYSVRYDVV